LTSTDVRMQYLSSHLSVSLPFLSGDDIQNLKLTSSGEKETAFRSPGPSSYNLCRGIISFVELHSKTRCADQPYLIAVGCVSLCVCVCVCVCVHIRFRYKNRLPGSICAQCAGKLGKQGSPWPSVLLLPPASLSRV